MILHLTEDAEGVSHFSDLPVVFTPQHFAPPAPALGVSLSEDCVKLLFLTLPAGWSGAKHRAPRRQIAFCLAGRLMIEAGDGAVREIGPGGIWRMEDTQGSGHATHVVGEEDVLLAMVQLD